MYQYINNIPITIFGDGNQKRAFSYIDDSLEPLFLSIIAPQASKQIINLGGIYSYTINEAADILLNILGSTKKQYLEPRHEVKYAYATYQKSIDLFGFQHKTSLEDGLRDMWIS